MKLTKIQRRVLNCMQRNRGKMVFGGATLPTWRALQRHGLVWWRDWRFRLTKKGRTYAKGANP